MTACTSPACPRRGHCGRHQPDAEHGTDYSHGHWFHADHCFWFKPRTVTRAPRRRVANLYAGGWP